jgi:hypothetical protein
MRAAVTAVLAATAVVALAPAAHAGTPQQAVPRFGIDTEDTHGVPSHNRYSMQVDTIKLNKLGDATVKLRCLGCNSHRHVRPRHLSHHALKFGNLSWLVGSSDFIEVDVSRSGYVGRWLRLGLRTVKHPTRGASCFSLPGNGKRYQCLLKLHSGCLVGATQHTACPPDTPVQSVDHPDGAKLPNTTLSSGPTGLVNSRTATFTYSSDVGTGYQCKLDDDDWLTCPADQNQYAGLSDGRHTFSVRAVLHDQPDPNPPNRTWTVDATPPHTTITAGPSGAVQGASGTFFYASSEGGTRFDCDLDFQGWIPCNGGHATFSYSQSGHSLAVRAIDAAGNVDPNPATTTWRRFPDDGTAFGFDVQDQGFFRHVENEADWHTAGAAGTSYWYFNTFPHCDAGDTSRNWAEWEPSGLPPGAYDVYAFVPSNTPSASGTPGADLASQVRYTVMQADASELAVTVSQAGAGGSWILLTSFTRLDGSTFITANDDDSVDAACDNKIVAADAVKVVYRSP